MYSPQMLVTRFRVIAKRQIFLSYRNCTQTAGNGLDCAPYWVVMSEGKFRPGNSLSVNCVTVIVLNPERSVFTQRYDIRKLKKIWSLLEWRNLKCLNRLSHILLRETIIIQRSSKRRSEPRGGKDAAQLIKIRSENCINVI